MEKYEPLGVVGEGSYGVVLKCRCRENGRIVAIKKFIDSEDDQNVRKIALREIRVLRKLRHENLVNLIEVFRRRKHIYLVFEFIDHTLLDQLEQKSHGLDEETCRKYIFQIVRGLGFCHDNNIIHRDVKPENILVSKAGIVKLCDFGFARNVCGPGDMLTDYVATRWYRAPELLVGDIAYGKEVDIWAVGCLFAEMMTGEPLFPGDSDIDQLFLIGQCLGRLAKRHLNIMARNSAFRGFQYPKSRHGSTTSTGSSKYPGQQQQSRNRSGSKASVFSIMFPSWPDDAIVFLTLSLEAEPSARPTCGALLRLPYFVHDNFPTRFLSELNQKLQQEGRQPIKAFSKKQTQRIANVSPSVPLPGQIPTKHIQSSHPILRNISMDENSIPSLKLQLLQSQNNNSSTSGNIVTTNTNNNSIPTTNTTNPSSTSMSLSRQNTFVVDKIPNGNTSNSHHNFSNAIINTSTTMVNSKVPKALSMEPQSRIPRKLSDDALVITPTVSHQLTTTSVIPSSSSTNNIFAETINQTQSTSGGSSNPNNNLNPLSTHFQTHPLPHPHSNHSHHPSHQQQETRRFSMSKNYKADDRRDGGVDGLSMNMNLNNNRQLPVTTLTFLGSNMFMTSNAPTPLVKSPNTSIHHTHHSHHHSTSNLNSSSSHSLGLKKSSISPKKSNIYSQSSFSKPVAFGSSINTKESFLPRMKILDDNNTSFPFLALGSPSKPVRKDRKWEPNQTTTLSRKPSTTGIHEKSMNEISREVPSNSPKNTLPFM